MARTSFEFEFGNPRRQPARDRDEDAPRRFVILGDWSGRASRGIHSPETLSTRKLVRIDIDNFDEVLRRISPSVRIDLAGAGNSVDVTINSLDDFDADSLYDRLDVFASLRESRQRLLDPRQFADEAARLAGTAQSAKGPEPSSPTAPSTENDSGTDLFGQLLGQKSSSSSTPSPSRSSGNISGVNLDQLIRSAVGANVVPKADPRQAEFVKAIDQALADQLRRLMHAKSFQACEAAWRQLSRLVSAAAGSELVQIFLLDVTRAEVDADLLAVTGIEHSGLYRLLIEHEGKSVGSSGWEAIALLEQFGPGLDDCRTLAGLAALAFVANGVALADASANLVGLADWSLAGNTANWTAESSDAYQPWRALRSSSLATSVGLAGPRPLVRLPYGPAHPSERFSFDELGPIRSHDSFLWGSAALACLEVAARAVAGEDAPNDLDDLPPCLYVEDGEKKIQPAAEVFLSERAAQALAERGVIPLLSFRDRHALRVARLQSLAINPTAILDM